MNIIYKNITLRAVELEDDMLLLSLINDPETENLLGGWSFPVSKQNQIDWIKSLSCNATTLRCIIESNNQESLGTIFLTDIDYKNGNAEIHIKLDKNFRGKGFGTKAINAMVDYAFNELRLHIVYSRVSNINIASKKMFEKCGFGCEGCLKDRIYKQGEYLDVLSYSIIRSN